MTVRPTEALTAGDVVILVRWQFWSWNRSLFEATRAAAAAALIALAGVGLYDMARLARTDWRPGGKAVVVVRRQHRVVDIPITPELDHVVETYLAERDKLLPDDRGPLLATARRRGVRPEYLGYFQFTRTTQRLGLKRPLTRLLKNFAVRSFERDGDKGAVAAILSQGYRIRRRRIEDVKQGRLAALVRRRNPLKGMLRSITTAQLPPDFRSRLPEISKPPQGYRGKTPHRRKPLPDHPAFAALLAVRWPDDRAARKALGAKLALEYAGAVEPFVETRRIKGEQARELFGGVMQWEWYRTLARRQAERDQRKAMRVARRERKRRRKAIERERRNTARRPTRADNVLLRQIAAHEWPTDNKAVLKFRCTMLARYLPAVAAMIRAGRYTQREAAALFRTSGARISRWMMQLERTGTFEAMRFVARNVEREALELRLEAVADAAGPAGVTVTDAIKAYVAATPECPVNWVNARNIAWVRQRARRDAAANARRRPARPGAGGQNRGVGA